MSDLPGKIEHIVNFSGGVGSYCAAKRVAARHGTDHMVLLFADTLIEDADLYRFLGEAADDVGAPLVKIADGRTPWEVFKDVRFLGTARVDPCSNILKRKLLDDWIESHAGPESCTVYVGIDWTEKHRIDRLEKRKLPWVYKAPMCEEPYVSKQSMMDQVEAVGIELPRLYKLGFPHNNCGGGCVKAGHAHFRHLYKQLPEVFAEWERNEQEIRDHLERDDIAILRDRTGGETRPITLRELREKIESGDSNDQMEFDWGGCGCAVE